VPDVVVGDYTIVHVGFALTKLDEKSALETLELFRSVGLLDEELNVVQTPTGPTSAAG
jgi:hydrogenase expression/formation protein HypC